MTARRFASLFPPVLALALLAGCAGGLPPLPERGGAAAVGNAEGRRLLQACLEAHGGAAAFARLRDVNVRYDGRWAAVGPRLQPKLSDTAFRGGSEERYLPARGGFVVGQHHTGASGQKHVFREPRRVEVSYNGRVSADREARAAAALVVDAYSMFLFGPEFFVRRGATVERLNATATVDGRACDELLAVLRPGFGEAAEDRVVLFIDQGDHRLRRVQFTLNGLESTRGAEVHVDLSAHTRLAGAGVLWPTRFVERIDRPVALPAHRWAMTGFDVNRGFSAADLAGTDFRGRAAAPAGPLTAAPGRDAKAGRP